MVGCATAINQGCGLARRAFGLAKGRWIALIVFSFALAAGFILEPKTVHFAFTGVDWDRVPKGYHGALPEKIYMELEIPREYVNTTIVPFLFWSGITENLSLYWPSSKRRSSVYINAYYPSMKAALGAVSDERIGVILSATEPEHHIPTGARMLHSGVTREPALDHESLCGYVDTVNIGWKGNEFYVPCKPPSSGFFIDCSPPWGKSHPCTEYVFLGQRISVSLSYQHRILEHHEAIVDAVRKLVFSFVRPMTDD